MDQEDFNYLMRHGELPNKSSETKKVDNQTEEEDSFYYSSSDYQESKSEKIWRAPETRVPFWLASIIMIILIIIDLSNGAAFDIDFIFAILVFWIILFIGAMIIQAIINWIRK